MHRIRTIAIAAALLTGSTALAAGTAEKGKDVFDQNCSVCHNSDSTETKIGPGLKGVFKRAKLVNGKPVNEANVKALINEGSPNGMPSYKDMLSDQEKDDVIAFLKTL